MLLVWLSRPTGAWAAQGLPGTLVSWGDQVIPLVPPGIIFKAIAGATEHSLALRQDGTVYAWGANDSGQSTVPEGLPWVLGSNAVNTLVATSASGGSTSGPVVVAGHNLGSDAAALRLGPLADNGGPTLTMALLPGSPAIGAADSASAPPTDQRGFPRPSGAAHIGAYEFGPPPILEATQPPEGGVDISVSGRAGQTCRLLASPDLVSWTATATNSFGPSGVFMFHDPAGAGQTQRFYRAVMP